MSDTPRTDANHKYLFFERELNELKTAWQEQTIVRHRIERDLVNAKKEIAELTAELDLIRSQYDKATNLPNQTPIKT